MLPSTVPSAPPAVLVTATLAGGKSQVVASFFEFVANNVALPAGDYQIMTRRQHLVTLRNVDLDETVTTRVTNVALDSVAVENRLVFRHDEDHNALHQVILAGDFHGHDLTHGKAGPELPSH